MAMPSFRLSKGRFIFFNKAECKITQNTRFNVYI